MLKVKQLRVMVDWAMENCHKSTESHGIIRASVAKTRNG